MTDNYICESTNYMSMVPAESPEDATKKFCAGLPEGEEFLGVCTIPEFMAKGDV
jgi:hypothetical protein